MKPYKKEIDRIFEGIADERAELPESAQNTIAALPKPRPSAARRRSLLMRATAVVLVPLLILMMLSPVLLPLFFQGGSDLSPDPSNMPANPNEPPKPGGPNNPFDYSSANYYQNAVALAAVKTMDGSKAQKNAAPASYRIAGTPPDGSVAPAAGNPVAAQVDGSADFAAPVAGNPDISGVNGLSDGAAPLNELYTDEEGNLRVTYAYTAVRIDRAYEFYIKAPQGTDDFVTKACGDGTLRAIVANFILYDGPDGGLAGEMILVVIGEKGMVHCLDGGGPGDVEFSMHKFLSGEGIEKNTKFEGYGFCVLADGDYHSYTQGNHFLADSAYDLRVVDKDSGTTLYRFVQGSYDECGAGEIYSFTDLCPLFADVTVLSEPSDPKQSEGLRFLVSYVSVSSGIQQEITIITTAETAFEGITAEEITVGKYLRIEFEEGSGIIDGVWALCAVKIIALETGEII